MKGDFTRSTFDPKKHNKIVMSQQGRVWMDADWNEQQEITLHRIETESLDVIGVSGGPMTGAGFEISLVGTELQISKGRYYVDGILCENDADVSINLQPDLQNAPVVRLTGSDVPITQASDGFYFAYLDVWTQHRTALEDPSIREVALGGPDTATRARNVWQVKLLRIGDVGQTPTPNCSSISQDWDMLVTPATGKLSARAQPEEASDKPCIVAPGAGFRRLENQLYRVEVHRSGDRDTATFKWSRDNGSIVVGWQPSNAASDAVLTVTGLGRDKVMGFAPGQWIELIDDTLELQGKPGTLVRLIKVEGTVFTIDQSVNQSSFSTNPRVRRWDSAGELKIETPTTNGGWLKLEDGVEIKFEAGAYKTGDYWLIPARTAGADVEWPKEGNNPAMQLPLGIRHHFCRLALLKCESHNWSTVKDCRKLFPPLTDPTTSPALEAIHVTGVFLNPAAPATELHNDTMIEVQDLLRGIRIDLDGAVNQLSVREKPICFITLELPMLTGSPVSAVFGYQPVILAAIVDSVSPFTSISWMAVDVTKTWLTTQLFKVNPTIVRHVLARLTLKGNFIWGDTTGGERIYLDGNAFGQRLASNTDLFFPSGDGVKGGDFEMWFKLRNPTTTPTDPDPPTGLCFAAPEKLSFDSVGQTQVVTIHNGSTEPAPIQSLVAQPSPPFSVDQPPERTTIPPHGDFPASVTYKPDPRGPSPTEGTLTISLNLNCLRNPRIPLSVSLAFAAIGLSTTDLAFGTLARTTTVPPKKVSLSNTGNAKLEVRLSTDQPHFKVSPEQISVDPGGSQDILVSFLGSAVPTKELSGAKNAAINLTTNDPGKPTVAVPVTWTLTTGTGNDPGVKPLLSVKAKPKAKPRRRKPKS